MKTTWILFLTIFGIALSSRAESSQDGQQWDGLSAPAQASRNGFYYDWGRAMNGWGYCYQWTSYGQVLNNGQPVPNWYCEQSRPSTYNWGRGMDGWGYCYHYTPYGIPMDEGRPQSNYYCERSWPSYYRWGQGMDGYAHCYQYTGNGIVMNQGQPVSNYFCQ